MEVMVEGSKESVRLQNFALLRQIAEESTIEGEANPVAPVISVMMDRLVTELSLEELIQMRGGLQTILA